MDNSCVIYLDLTPQNLGLQRYWRVWPLWWYGEGRTCLCSKTYIS